MSAIQRPARSMTGMISDRAGLYPSSARYLRGLIVKNREREIVGMLSVDDLARYSQDLAGEVLEAVPRGRIDGRALAYADSIAGRDGFSLTRINARSG